MSFSPKHDPETEAGRAAMVAEHTRALRLKAVANAIESAARLVDDLKAAHAGADMVVSMLLLPLLADSADTLNSLRSLKSAMEQTP